MRVPRVLAFAACAALLVALGLFAWNRVELRAQAAQLDGNVVESTIVPPGVALTDQDGRPFRLDAQRGREVVLFFGYAHCPDICPTTLAKLASAEKQLGARASSVVVAFVTVDPQRDTVPMLKRYVDLFDPRFYGLTGTPAALAAVYRAYHVWFQKLPNQGSAAGYLMAHSSAIYLLDPAGRLRVIHDWSDSTGALAHDMGVLAG